MNRIFLSAALVLALTAGGSFAYRAAADTNPPPGPDQPGTGPWGDPGHHHGGPMGPGPGVWAPWRMGPGGPLRDEKFSLFAPVKNKNLSAADVKIIATALLLERGNHDWGVTNIITEPDKSIDFSFSTPHGDVIATFAVDPASGHMTRVG